MLSVERKKTDKVDLVRPLQDYIRNHYSGDAAQDHLEALNNLQQLREDVRNIQDKNEATRDLLLKYYGLLLSVESRFPISETNIRINFAWTDVYKNKKQSQFNIFYEKQNVLFNIGAMYSQLGSLQNRSTGDGLKIAYSAFSSSAGAFEELKSELEKHPQPTMPDLAFDSVNMLINLMLAQAQECFVEKSLKESGNPALLAKLSAQTADWYESANALLATPAMAPNAPKNWSNHIQMKAAMAKATAHAQLAAVAGQANEYGPQVGRLVIARNLLEDAKKKFLKAVPADVQTQFNNFQAQVLKNSEAAEKENDLIYHDTVPPEARLINLEKRGVAKPVPLPETIRLTPDRDPFTKLVPFAITEKLSVYQERKESVVRNEMRAIEEHNQLAIGSLSSMSLPGAIEALESTVGGGLPKALEEKRQIVHSEGGARLIIELVETLNKLAEEDGKVLAEATAKLDTEEKADNAMRQQWATRWSRTPSHTLTANLRQEAAKFKGNFDHARKSDTYVLKKFQDHQQFIVKLSGSANDVMSLLPTAQSSQNSNSPAVKALKQSLTLLDRLIAERNNLKKELSQMSQFDDISTKLMANKDVADEELFAIELGKYEAVQSKLQASFQEQEELLNRIQLENAEFVTSRGGNNPTQQREQVIQQLTTAFKIYTELKNNLNEGIQFYTNFQEILRNFSQKCEDFVFARETEKSDILTEIQAAATGMSHLSVSSAPSHAPTPSAPQYQPQPQQAPQQYQPPPQQNYGATPSAPQYGQPSNSYGQPANSYVQPTQASNPQAMPGAWQPNMKPVFGPAPTQTQPQQPYGYQQPPVPYGYPPQGYAQTPQNYGQPPMQQQQPYGYQQPPMQPQQVYGQGQGYPNQQGYPGQQGYPPNQQQRRY